MRQRPPQHTPVLVDAVLTEPFRKLVLEVKARFQGVETKTLQASGPAVTLGGEIRVTGPPEALHFEGEVETVSEMLAKANVALWRTRGEHQPLVGEFAFQVKFKRRQDLHDKARERCAKFFIHLQQIGAGWIYLGATKTGMVYRLKGNPPQSHE